MSHAVIIPLRSRHAIGRVARVSPEDAAHIEAHRWSLHAEGYSCRYECRSGKPDRKIFMHHEILHRPQGLQTDHVNGDRLDNRRENLRNATLMQNRWNRRITGGTSRYKGVYLHQEGVWRARIKADGVSYHLGLFHDEIAAAHAYDAGAKRHHGRFARLNFPEGEAHGT